MVYSFQIMSQEKNHRDQINLTVGNKMSSKQTSDSKVLFNYKPVMCFWPLVHLNKGQVKKPLGPWCLKAKDQINI